jgi:hypothetical protein
MLWERGRKDPLIGIPLDSPAHAGQPNLVQFGPDGRHVAWGNVDGTVTVCDLEEVQKRLTEIGLGW